MSDEKSPRVSLIVVYTRDDQLAEATKWIDEQTIRDKIELIVLDNRGNCAYSSSAEALNDGAAKANGEFLIFMHQDIYLWDVCAAQKYAEFLQEHPNAIIGVAGVCSDGVVRYDIWQTKEKYRFELPASGEIYSAETLDECMFAMTKARWQALKFDEETCNNWHFYGADICYHNLSEGGENFLVPLEVCHDSLGTPGDKNFNRSLKRMIIKYRGHLPYIKTTCIRIKCTLTAYRKYLLREKMKLLLRIIVGKRCYERLKRKRDDKKRAKGEYVSDYDEISMTREQK